MTTVTEEKQIERLKFAGAKKASMKRRDAHHDYTERRMYMVTLEVEGRRPVFGHLVGDAFAERGSLHEPRIELSELGKAVQSEWLGIHRHYPQIEVKAVQMMPDHMHGILFVREKLPMHLGQVISGFKAGCRKAQRALAAAAMGTAAVGTAVVGAAVVGTAAETQFTEKGAPPKGAPTSQYSTALASPSSAPLPSPAPFPSPSPAGSRAGFPSIPPLFAKGYNDLILRSYDELSVWQNYLRDNPRRLMMKRARPDWLRPFFGLRIGSHSYSGIGNRSLLAAPKRIAVRVSRRRNDSEIVEETARYLNDARQGAVLVSPAISPGEKRVMRAAFDAGLPIIVIMENGFTPMSKPHGERFDACAKGLLLMLSPWEHHNERKKITAEQCQQMNLMALEICRQQ